MLPIIKSLAFELLLCNFASAAYHFPGVRHNHALFSRQSTTNSTTVAQCGKNAPPGNETCPLNVCCSSAGNCGTTADFCGTGCQNGCDAIVRPSCEAGASPEKRTVGYYESWSATRACQTMSPEQLNVTGYTHINYAFMLFEPAAFAIASIDGNDTLLIPRFTDIKTTNPGLQTWISIGGWNFNEPGPTQSAFSDMVGSSANRTKFINEIMHFMNVYAFDGLDIDWEYPSASDRGGKPADRDNLALFTKEVRAAFGTTYGLSVTLPASYYYMQNFDVAAMEQYVDFFNLMSYDLHGIWDKTSGDGPYIRPHTNITEIDAALDLLWRSKIAPEKANMGMAFYGRSFTLKDTNCTTPNGICEFTDAGLPGPCSAEAGSLNLQEIQDIISKENLMPTLDKAAAIKYTAYNKTEWVAYDDAETIQMKQAFASSRCLGGTMVWAVDQADQTSACGLPKAVRPPVTNSSMPLNGTYGSPLNGTYGAPSDCSKIKVSANTTTCESIIATARNVTTAQLKAWNPTLQGSCSALTQGQSLCVSPPGGWYAIAIAPPPDATTTGSANAPTNTQAGIASDCKTFATASAGDTCISFAGNNSIQPAQLYAWNPVLGVDGSACSTSFWADESYCVSAGPNTTASGNSTTAGNSTASGSSSGAGLTQAGIASDCTTFATAVAGDGCTTFAVSHGIQPAQLYTWNPALGINGSSCTTSLWAGYSYCVGVGGSGASVTASSGLASGTGSPTPDSMTGSAVPTNTSASVNGPLSSPSMSSEASASSAATTTLASGGANGSPSADSSTYPAAPTTYG